MSAGRQCPACRMVGGHLRTCGSWGRLDTFPGPPVKPVSSNWPNELLGVEAAGVTVDPAAIRMPRRGDNPTLSKLLEFEADRYVKPNPLIAKIDRLARLMHPGGTMTCPVCGEQWKIEPPVLVQDDVATGTYMEPAKTSWLMQWQGHRAADVETMLLEHLAGHASVLETGLTRPDDPGPAELAGR